MSFLFSPDSEFLQRFLKSGGFYNGKVDGDVGPETRGALTEFNFETDGIANDEGSFDKQTEEAIHTMLVPTQHKAREFMSKIEEAGLSPGLTVHIVSGTRTFAEQAELFEKHQHGGPLAASPGHSNHNFGIAWDVGIFNANGEYIDELIHQKRMTSKAVDAEYKKVGAYGKSLGLFWGGDWSDPDYPHFQMRDNNELASIRNDFEDGKAIV